mgnify:CR=1 FL=1
MFEGIITPMVTPFHYDDNQSINYEAAEKLIDYLINKGVSGIFILGSNGEFHVIDEDEKIEFTKRVVKYVNHRVPVFVGTGTCSTRETIRLSKKAEELGADAISVISPYFIKISDEELYQHFKAIAKSVKIPMILYNIPRNTGINISADVLERLSSIENVKGIKDSSRDLDNLKGYLEVAKKHNMSVLIGSDSIIFKGCQMGASGAISGMSNVITDTLVNLYKALKSNDLKKAEKLQQDIEVIRNVVKLKTNPSVIKRAMELAEIAPVGPARKPVLEMDELTDMKIKEMLKYFHLI